MQVVHFTSHRNERNMSLVDGRLIRTSILTGLRNERVNYSVLHPDERRRYVTADIMLICMGWWRWMAYLRWQSHHPTTQTFSGECRCSFILSGSEASALGHCSSALLLLNNSVSGGSYQRRNVVPPSRITLLFRYLCYARNNQYLSWIYVSLLRRTWFFDPLLNLNSTLPWDLSIQYTLRDFSSRPYPIAVSGYTLARKPCTSAPHEWLVWRCLYAEKGGICHFARRC